MKKVKKMGMGGMPGTPVVNKAMPLPPGVPPTLMGLASMSRGPMGRGPMGGGPRGPMGGMPTGGAMPPAAMPVLSQSSLAQGMPPAPAGGAIQTIARKKGGAVSASKRADGCAQRGKTKGRMV